jgi:hypothetical protein
VQVGRSRLGRYRAAGEIDLVPGEALVARLGQAEVLAQGPLGVWQIQSEMLKVPNSEKYPLSKLRMKWHGSWPRHWSICPCPRGKYQMSPGSNSFVSEVPDGSKTVVRTRPSITSAHSAAVACQGSSRMAHGSSRIETPAIPLEIGNCLTVASLP